MKKIKLLMPLVGVTAIGAIVPAMAGCTQAKPQEDNPKVVVVFDTNGGSTIAPVYTPVGSTIPYPAEPTRLTYIFAGWYTDKGCTELFDFDTKITGNTVLYAGWINAEMAYSVPQQFLLPYCTASGKEYTTAKKLGVFCNGELMNINDLHFESDKTSIINITDDGLITPVAPTGTTTDNTATISVYTNNTDHKLLNTFSVTRYEDVNGEGWTFDESLITNVATTTYYPTDDFGNCVLPDYVVKADDEGEPITYNITLEKPSDQTSQTAMAEITNLWLPLDLVSINATLFSDLGTATSKLLNVYYPGTVTQYKWVIRLLSSNNWVSNQVIGVQCYDGMALFVQNYDTDVELIEEPVTKSHFLSLVSPSITDHSSTQYSTVRFDYSKLGYDALAGLHNVICYYGVTILNPQVEVYHDGIKLEAGDDKDYTFKKDTSMENLMKITLNTDKVTLTTNSNIVVKIKDAIGTTGKGWYLGTIANLPTQIKVTKKPSWSRYQPKEKFSSKGMIIDAVMQGGETFTIPNEYIELTWKNGIPLKDGYEFKSTDTGTHEITVTEHYTGLTTTFQITVGL